MTSHVALLGAALRDRSVWDELDAAGEAVNVPEDLRPVADYIRDYYAADQTATSVDAGLMHAALVETIRDPKRRTAMQEALAVLANADPSVPNARRAVRAVRSRRVAETLATRLLLPSREEKAGEPTIVGLIDEYMGLQDDSARDETPAWTPEVIAPMLGEPRIPVYPRSLGDRLRGGLWPGHHMIVFARPEVGKTALALTIAVMAASRAKARVLYLSNEDSVRDLMLRALSLFGRRGTDEVLKNLPEVLEQARKFGADRLMFRDMSPGSLPEIDRLVRKIKPDLLIVDQMRNIGVGKAADNMTQRLDAAAQGLRNIAKRHQTAVISLTQAGDSARDKATLDDGDVDYSNTGIAAGCDVLIGIGCTPVMRDAGERRLAIIKNKLGGTHGYADVRLDQTILAYRDRQ